MADGDGADAKLLAVCVYHGYMAPMQVNGQNWYGVCEVSFAAASPRWATRRTIANLLDVPFRQFNCRKVAATIPFGNTRAIEFCTGIGLKLEATLRHHFAKGVHAQIHGMLRSEYEARWLNPRPKVRRSPGSAARRRAQTIGTASA